MAKRYIAELGPGERLEHEVFLVKSKDLRTTTQGSLYIHAVLADRTGQLVARHWQATEGIYKQIPEGGFMRFTGRVENYKGNLQFIVDGIGIADPGTYDLGEFLPATSCNVDQMWQRTQAILSEVKHPHLAELVKEYLADEELMDRFRRAPAATTMHHAYIGGLLEHTLSVLEVATKVIPHYPKLSLDLVLVGVFLHDIGKTSELTFQSNIGYSDHGQLVGHIALATIWVGQKAEAVAARTGMPFPDDLLSVLQHIILSHHGRYEYGSPKLPAIPEAVAIHYLDNLDAKINQFLTEIDKDPDTQTHWTNYNRALETKIYKPDLMGSRPREAAATSAK